MDYNIDLKCILTNSKSLDEILQKLANLSSAALLSAAKNSLDYFMLTNFAGIIEKCPSYAKDEKAMVKINEGLSFDYNTPYKFARSKVYLWLAKMVLMDNSSQIKDDYVKRWLTCRLVLLWQFVLNEPAIQLRTVLDALPSNVDVSLHDSVPKTSVAEAWIEKMYAHLMYNQISKAEICLKNALNVLGLEIEMTGIMGKRTRFQQNFIPQLIVKATGGNSVTEDEFVDEISLPTNVLLHDDSLLESVCIAETESSFSRKELPSISLACILASCVFEKKIQSTDSTVIEKCCSYLDEVIAQRKNWAIQTSALMHRCEFEKNRMRRVERACMQMETLSKLMSGTEVEEISFSNLRGRLNLLLASGLKPFWFIDTLHAEILRSLGCTAEAISIYEKREDWDSVVDCYQSLGQLEKAERLVRDLIAKNEKESNYWCLLGDILNEPSSYEKAIQVSNGRSYRAYRSLGMLMLHRKRYDMSYQNLKRSLELQPINASAWFNFGCCAWRLEKWEEAARAYRECVRYEPAHFQAWNNLAAVYEKLNDAEKAKRLLQEALKLNFEHAKMRENYMLLCVRTHDFSSAITAFHTLLDLNKQFKDDTVIETLTQKLITLRKEDEESTKFLIDQMCELLGRITSQQTCSETIWRCYAELKKPSEQDHSLSNHEHYVRLLERAFGASRNKQGWHKNEDSCCAVLDAVMNLVKAKLVLARMKNADYASIESEIRINLRPIVTAVEKIYGADGSEASGDQLREYLVKAKAIIVSKVLIPE